MIPNYFMHLSEFPMTPSGKLDRKNLPVPKVKMGDLTGYVQPSTEIEKKLCQIMENVLGFEPIGLQHDFFAYGGDSLKAMEFIVRAEEQQMKIQKRILCGLIYLHEILEVTPVWLGLKMA